MLSCGWGCTRDPSLPCWPQRNNGVGWGFCVSSPEMGRGSLLSSDLCSHRRGCFRKTFYMEHKALLLGKVNSPRWVQTLPRKSQKQQLGLPGSLSSTHMQGTEPVLTGSAWPHL